MVRKRFQEAKTGLEWLKSVDPDKYLSKVGLGRKDHEFWKKASKALLSTYALFGAGWLYNETSPFGWWSMNLRPKEEREMAHLYERVPYPYPGDEEAMKEFIAKGGAIGTSIGPKGTVVAEKDMVPAFQKELQDRKFEQEAQKLWTRMRSEVISELQEKGFDVDED